MKKNDIEVYLVPIAVSMGPKPFWSLSLISNFTRYGAAKRDATVQI